MSAVITSIGFAPPKIHKQNGKIGVTATVTPVSYPFESVITASKHLPCGGCPEGVQSFCGMGMAGIRSAEKAAFPRACQKAPGGEESGSERLDEQEYGVFLFVPVNIPVRFKAQLFVQADAGGIVGPDLVQNDPVSQLLRMIKQQEIRFIGIT